MVVREALGAPLPLAGVACAIDRNPAWAGWRTTWPRDGLSTTSSLTEDYELGLKIGAVGGRTIMARIDRPAMASLSEQARLLSGHPDRVGPPKNPLADRASRWPGGTGWGGTAIWAQKWMLVHDRRRFSPRIVLLAAYGAIVLTAALALAEAADLAPAQAAAFRIGRIQLLFINAAVPALAAWRFARPLSGALYGVGRSDALGAAQPDCQYHRDHGRAAGLSCLFPALPGYAAAVGQDRAPSSYPVTLQGPTEMQRSAFRLSGLSSCARHG